MDILQHIRNMKAGISVIVYVTGWLWTKVYRYDTFYKNSGIIENNHFTDLFLHMRKIVAYRHLPAGKFHALILKNLSLL